MDKNTGEKTASEAGQKANENAASETEKKAASPEEPTAPPEAVSTASELREIKALMVEMVSQLAKVADAARDGARAAHFQELRQDKWAMLPSDVSRHKRQLTEALELATTDEQTEEARAMLEDFETDLKYVRCQRWRVE